MINISSTNDKYTQFNNLEDVSIQRRRVTYTLSVCKTAPGEVMAQELHLVEYQLKNWFNTNSIVFMHNTWMILVFNITRTNLII